MELWVSEYALLGVITIQNFGEELTSNVGFGCAKIQRNPKAYRRLVLMKSKDLEEEDLETEEEGEAKELFKSIEWQMIKITKFSQTVMSLYKYKNNKCKDNK